MSRPTCCGLCWSATRSGKGDKIRNRTREGIESNQVTAMPVTLPDDLLRSTKLTEAELKAELALALFQRERLTLGQAAILADLPQLDFQRLLATRQIPLHYGVEEMDQDLERAKRLPGA